MTKYLKLALLGVTLILSACATDYYTYQGAPVTTGTGGAAKNVNGIDLWIMGTPPRKFRIIGYITDSRPGGPIPMAMRDGAIASEARAKGGDAVIMNSDNSQLMGMANMTNVNAVYNSLYSTSVTMPIIRRNGTYYVIKYL
jgi:hypothetical protein